MRITAETKSATRERILDAASRLFRSKGWESTTTRDITAAAGIAGGTLFNYFQTKEAVAATLISDALIVPSSSRAPVAASLEEELFSLIWTGLRSLRKLRGFLSAAAETIFSPLARKAGASPGDAIRIGQLEAMQRMAAAHGYLTPMSPLTVQLYWTLYLGVFSFWAADESPHQEDTLALLDQSLKLFVASLSAGSKGEKRRECKIK
jgi:AcrR family transcriptional regulator